MRLPSSFDRGDVIAYQPHRTVTTIRSARREHHNGSQNE